VVFGQLVPSMPSPPAAITWNAGNVTRTTTNGAFLVSFAPDLGNVKFAVDLLPQSTLSYPSLEPRGLAISPQGEVAISGTVPTVSADPQTGGPVVLTSYKFENAGGVIMSNGVGYSAGFVAQYSDSGKLSFAKVWATKTAIPEGNSCRSWAGGVAYEASGDLLVLGTASGYPNPGCDYVADSAKLTQLVPDFSGSYAANAARTTLLLLRYKHTDGAFSGGYRVPKTISDGSPRGIALGRSGDVYALVRSTTNTEFGFGSKRVMARSGAQSAFLFHFKGGAALDENSELDYRLIASTQPSPNNEVTSIAIDPLGQRGRWRDARGPDRLW
jgi:hypothetical protein